MGCGYCHSPKERPFFGVDYSNIQCIQGLLRYYYSFYITLETSTNTQLLAVLVDIQRAVKNTTLTDKQRNVIKLYMEGYTESEIAEILDLYQSGVHQHLYPALKKISKYLTKDTD